MPSVTYQTMKNKLYPSDMLSVTGPSAKVVSGGRITDLFTDKVEYKEYKPEVQFCQVPGMGKVEYQFFITGKGSVEITFDSRKAGTRKAVVELK
jgi:hypothetical protein